MLLDEMRALGLPAGHFVLFGSAPLLVRGIVPPTGDVDVLVRGPAWDVARTLGPVVRLSPYDVEVVRLLDTAEIIDGLPFARLAHVRAYKELAGRPKDREHLRRLEAWESSHR